MPSVGNDAALSGYVDYAPDAADKKITIALKSAGGQILIPAFAGFRGTLPYASNDARKTVTLTLTNSGASNRLGAPNPYGKATKLFLSAQISGKVSVTFKSSTAKGAIRSSQFVHADRYAIYLYEGKKQVGKIDAARSSNEALRFTTPFSKLTIAPSTPLVLELVAAAPLAATPATLSFASAAAQTITVTEADYTGTFTATSSKPRVAAVNPVKGSNGPSATFLVAPVGGGTCTITFTDTNGQAATVRVAVNSGVIKVNSTSTTSMRRGD